MSFKEAVKESQESGDDAIQKLWPSIRARELVIKKVNSGLLYEVYMYIEQKFIL